MATGKVNNVSNSISKAVQLSAGSFTAPSDGYLILRTLTGSTTARAYAKIGEYSGSESGVYICITGTGTYAGCISHYMRKGMSATVAFTTDAEAWFMAIS